MEGLFQQRLKEDLFAVKVAIGQAIIDLRGLRDIRHRYRPAFLRKDLPGRFQDVGALRLSNPLVGFFGSRHAPRQGHGQGASLAQWS